MFNDRTATGQAFIEGTKVYDANGDQVGTIHDYDTQGGYLVVEKGWLFKKDLYIPVDAVARSDDDGIYLRYTKDELGQPGFESPQAGDATAGMTVGTTSPTWDDTREAAAQGYDATTGSTDRATGDIEVPVYQEELVAGKRVVEEGRVRIHKDVVVEEQTVNVPLRQERVTVERVPASGDVDATAATDAFIEKDIDVPVMGEEPVVGKQVRGVEEVRVRKDAMTDEQQVSDTVRKERVTVDGADDLDDVADRSTGTSRVTDRTVR